MSRQLESTQSIKRSIPFCSEAEDDEEGEHTNGRTSNGTQPDEDLQSHSQMTAYHRESQQSSHRSSQQSYHSSQGEPSKSGSTGTSAAGTEGVAGEDDAGGLQRQSLRARSGSCVPRRGSFKRTRQTHCTLETDDLTRTYTKENIDNDDDQDADDDNYRPYVLKVDQDEDEEEDEYEEGEGEFALIGPQQPGKIRPNLSEKFRSAPVQHAIEKSILEVIGGQSYSATEASEWVKQIVKDILERTKAMKFIRYKLIAQVVLGERKGEGVMAAQRCLWDEYSDYYASFTYIRESLFCIGTVYAVYLY